MAQRLATTRYTLPGTYIGELIQPRPGNLSADARVTSVIGKGSRLATLRNSGIRRSFVSGESITIPSSAPFTYTLQYPADGVKAAPARVFDSTTGIELREDQWDFIKVGPSFTQIILNPDAVSFSANYKIDYQSTSRDIKDVLPVTGLRVIKAVGSNPDRAEFKDFTDFYIPYQFTGPFADSGNSTPASFLTAIFPDVNNTGGGVTTLAPAAQFNHNYNRFYEVECLTASGGPGSFIAQFQWSAQRYSGGLDSLPPTPIDLTFGTKPTFTVDETILATQFQDLELGVQLQFAFSGTNFSVGDKFYLNGVGPGLLEFDGRLSNSNQNLEFDSILPTYQPGSTGSFFYASTNAYTGTYNLKYKLQCISSGGAGITRTASFIYATYGEILGPTGQVTATFASPILNLPNGVKIEADFGAGNFVTGDVFDFQVKAPRLYYQAKDDRAIKMSIATATNPGADSGIVTGSFSTGTSEGGYGSFTAEVNTLTNVNAQTGFFVLPDNVSIAARNAMQGNINGTSYAAGDIFNGTVTSTEVIDWSLTSIVEETREVSAIFIDVTGQVTGTAGTRYAILNNNYISGTVSVVDDLTSSPISFIEIPNSRLIAFVIAPTATVRITYEYAGKEPAPGTLYFLTANYLRPDSMYNTNFLILEKQEGRNLLAPSTIDNHLYIANELAFDNGAPGISVIQPKDSDGDGILTTTDIQTALDVHKGLKTVTDLCLLSLFDSLSDALAANVQLNDPFEKKEQMLWVGVPIGTPIGDVDTQGSLIYLALNTLQVPLQSPAYGSRVLLAPDECRKNIALENGLTQEVRLDGSFVAAATSFLVNSFQDPATTILKKNVAGFTYIKTYSEPENLLLGQASITFLSDLGSSVFRYEEDITVHTADDEFQLISGGIQKQYVTKVVRREMDNALISVVAPSPQASVALIRSVLAGILQGLLGRGILAPYQDDSGNDRNFDSGKDIVIYRDTQSRTQYYFSYAYYIRFPIKRLFGLYGVNTNDLGV